MIDPDAPQIVARDDAVSCPETITERSQVGEASGDGGKDDQQDHGLDRPAPFARSSRSEPHEKPSKNRLARQHRRLYPTKLLHNARSTVGLSVCDDVVRPAVSSSTAQYGKSDHAGEHTTSASAGGNASRGSVAAGHQFAIDGSSPKYGGTQHGRHPRSFAIHGCAQ